MNRRLFSILVLILMATMGAWAETIDPRVTANDGSVLTGTLDKPVKIVADKATVTLSNVTINESKSNAYYWAGITCESNATIILEGVNTVNGFHEYYPGIHIAPGKTLTIKGEGSLNVSSNGYGAGIGAGWVNPPPCGNIVIESGIINATGGSNAAGIGGGNDVSCGDITIRGGNITATGGFSAAGIGAGYPGTCGDITIEGGNIIATGGESAAGIGARSPYTCGNITIKDCTIIATSDDNVAAIDKGDANNVTITIGGIERGSITQNPYYYLSLADDKDNSSTLSTYSSKTSDVTLKRTLYKDGSWNTICLPFSMTAGQVTAQLAPAKLMTLSNSSFSNGTLTLNFAEATTIVAGKPYIIKWNKADNYASNASAYDLTNPVFTDVIVDNSDEAIARKTQTSQDGKVSFKGTYDKLEYTTEDKSILFLGEANTLYWPKSGATIGACRAYFKLSPNAAVREFKLSFGEDDDHTNGIVETERNSCDPSVASDQRSSASLFTLHSSLSGWYTLDGRRLSGKPTQRGLYIDNGKKIVIK